MSDRTIDFLKKSYEASLSAQQAVQEVIDDLPRGNESQKLELVDARLDEVGVLLNEVVEALDE